MADIRSTIDAYCSTFTAGDRAGWLDCWADDATMEDPVGTPVKSGKDEIGAFYGTDPKASKSFGRMPGFLFQHGLRQIRDVFTIIGDRAVLSHTVRDESSGFVGQEVTPIVSCEDGNFRPVDLQFAPDGSLYIVDWHNALIGHLQHNLREPNRDHSHGRIWRITCRGRPLSEVPSIAGEPFDSVPSRRRTLAAAFSRTNLRYACTVAMP